MVLIVCDDPIYWPVGTLCSALVTRGSSLCSLKTASELYEFIEKAKGLNVNFLVVPLSLTWQNWNEDPQDLKKPEEIIENGSEKTGVCCAKRAREVWPNVKIVFLDIFLLNDADAQVLAEGLGGLGKDVLFVNVAQKLVARIVEFLDKK